MSLSGLAGYSQTGELQAIMEVEDGAGPEEQKQNMYFQRRTSQNRRAAAKPDIVLKVVEEEKSMANTYQSKD